MGNVRPAIKVKHTKLYALVMLLCLLFAAVSPASAREVRCHILMINDPHGHILPPRVLHSGDESFAGGLARSLFLLKEEEKKIKSEDGYPIFLFEGGDMMLGETSSEFSGLPEYNSLAITGFDAGVLGNHDFDGGVRTLAKLGPHLKLPILASNITFHSKAIQKYYAKTAVIKKDGLSVGCFGVITPGLKSLIKDGSGFDVNPDLVSIAKECVAELRAQSVDIIVAIDHIGLEGDMQLAKKVPGIDVMIGSHTHEAVGTKSVISSSGGRTLYGQAGLDGRYVGRFDVVKRDGVVDTEASSWKLLKVMSETPELKRIGDIGRDRNRRIAKKYHISNPVAEFTHEVDASFALVRTQENALCNVVADAMRWKAGADMALLNGGAVRIGGVVSSGDFTSEELFEMTPFNDNIVRAELKGGEIVKQLEIAASSLKREDEYFDPARRSHSGEFLQVSGLRVTYDMNGVPAEVTNRLLVKPGSRVVRVLVETPSGWRPIDREAVYSVAMPDYASQTFTAVSRKTLKTTYRAAAAEYMRKVLKDAVDPKTEGRIEIIKMPRTVPVTRACPETGGVFTHRERFRQS